MSFATWAKEELPGGDAAASAGHVAPFSKRSEDPDFSPEQLAKQKAAFLSGGGKVKQIPNGLMFESQAFDARHSKHADGRKKVNISLSTVTQRAAKERKAKQQWKEHAAT